MADLNFSGLAGVLLSRWEEFLPSWAPGGKLIGREYSAGTIRGGPGDSFKCNVETGRWADFSSNERGGDLISLYAAIEGIKNGEAAKRLADNLNYSLSDTVYTPPTPKITEPPKFIICPPPLKVAAPRMLHPKYGAPTNAWCYRDSEGNQIFWEARYDTAEGKLIQPWSWADNLGRWVRSGYPALRPLYGLDKLMKRLNTPVVIVEGPKCAEAAQDLMGAHYVPMTWNGGANAAAKTDWEPLRNRNLLIWPDADAPGIKVANQIASLVSPYTRDIKIIDVQDMPDKWDVADARDEGWDWAKVKEWAKPRAHVFALTAVATTNGTAPAVAVAQANVIVNTSDERESDVNAVAALELYGIATNRNGTPHCNIDNAVRALDNCPMVKDVAWFDTFQQKIYTTWNGKKREWTDRDTLELTKWLQRELGFIKLSDTTTFQAVTLYAHAHPKNEPRDWLETLVWDGQERITDFFVDYLGAKPSDYTKAAAKNFWIGMVARIYQPGCKMDNMVVLEGPQGTMKSTALHRIGGPWFTETNESVSNKDFFLILQGNLLVEIAELHTFSKAEVTRIKQVITCRVDRYRAPYERLVSDHPRQSVFVGSTNEDAYLKDTTGNRRFWPVKCGTIYPDEITAARDQLFAEAVHKYKAGATWWEMPRSETEIEQEERRQADAWESMIDEWITIDRRISFTTADVMAQCLKIEAGRMDKPSQQRVANILKRMGWESLRDWNNGAQRRIWTKPEAALPLT